LRPRWALFESAAQGRVRGRRRQGVHRAHRLDVV